MAFTDRLHNRGSISTGYDIDNSVKLEADNTEYLNRVIASGGNRKTWTISAWVKRTEISDATHGGGHTIFAVNVSGNEGCLLRFNTGTTAATLDTLQIDIGAGGTNSRSHTLQVFRDIAAWYHIVLAVDTTQSTATDRFKLYVNGELVTSYYNRNNPAQNFDTSNNQADNSCTQHIGAYTASGTVYGKFCGYIAEVNHVDGAALAPTEFGEFDDASIWKPIEASPTYGTNGFFLDFADSGNLGDDESGNGLDFTLTNVAAADQATDTPTNNFATSNFLISQGGYFVTTEGGTKCVLGTSGPGNNIGGVSALSTIAVSKGKWYMEMKNDLANDSVDSYARFGFVDVGDLADGGVDGQMIAKPGSAAGAYFGGTGGGRYHYNNTAQGNSTTWIRQIMGMALDLDNKKVYFHIDGTYTNSGDPANGTDNGGQYDMNTGGDGIYVDETWVLGASAYNLGIFLMNWGGYTVMPISSPQSDANGYGTFEYAPPSGYYALCSKNLAQYG